jgi:hypothetical protein
MSALLKVAMSALLKFPVFSYTAETRARQHIERIRLEKGLAGGATPKNSSDLEAALKMYDSMLVQPCHFIVLHRAVINSVQFVR